MEVIDAREWALLTWLGIALTIVVIWPKTRRGLSQLVTTPTFQIWAVFAMFAAWIGGSVYGALEIGLWERGLLGETIFWAAFTGIGLMFAGVEKLRSRDHFLAVVLAAFGFALLAEVYVNLYVFPYFFELLALPAIFVVTGLLAVAETKDEYRTTRRVLEFVLSVVGLGLVAFVTYQIVDGWNQIDWMGTFRAFALPIWLTFALIPFLYVLRVYVAYDSVFTRVGFEAANFCERWRARSAIALKLRLQLHHVAGLQTYWIRQLVQASDLRSALQVLDDYKVDSSRRERDRREADEKLARNAGIRGDDEEDRRLDEREFKETRNALHILATAQMGWYRHPGERYRLELVDVLAPSFEKSGLPSDHGISLWVAEDGQSWWAWRRTITGWCFSIGADGPPPGEWLHDGPEPPEGPPGIDPAWGEKWGLNAKNW